MALRRCVVVSLCAALGIIAAPLVWAQTDSFPNQTIKLLIGFAPGGSSDTVARIMAPKLGELLKQSIVIDNKPGAGGNIATDLLIKAPADGHTIMLGTVGSISVNQHLNKLSYNPITDMAPLSMAVIFSNVLVVNAPAKCAPWMTTSNRGASKIRVFLSDRQVLAAAAIWRVNC